MDKEKLVQRLMATFLGELAEHVRALNRDLLALEKGPGEGRAELLKTLFRTVHSLKGAARSVSVGPIEAVCHRLEGLLGAGREVGPQQLQLLFTAADALGEAGELLRAQGQLAEGSLLELLSRLEAAGNGPALRPDPPTSSRRSHTGPAATDGWVRLPAGKLDALLAHSGELLVARRRAGPRQENLEDLRELLARAQGEWRRAEKPLRRLLGPRPRKGSSGPEALPRRAALALGRTTENFKKLSRGLELLAARLAADQHALEQAAVPLEDEVRRARMLPFGDACEGFERLVRDLSRTLGKEVELLIEGREVELDRTILEGLKDPLLQLVRNAVDHGLESPEERRAQGKSPRGRITVAAALHGAGVEVMVADDGRGLDLKRIREQAQKRKLAPPEDPLELARLVFLPGFSTVPLITELSGRGVGLDVVKHRVESLHGTVDFTFSPGEGTRFALALPLTLTTLRAVLLGCAGQTFALPAASVLRLRRVGPAELAAVEGREVLLGEGAPLPVASLADVLGVPVGAPRAPGGHLAVAVVGTPGRAVAFAVDELMAEQELVVKTLGPRLPHVRNFAGATVLPTGRIALLLNSAELVSRALRRGPSGSVAALLEPRAPARKKRLLVADDSVTTRTLEKSILEAAGYEVVVAADGAEAWRLLQEAPPDLVVADVEMPRLDGFSLTAAIRSSTRLRALPVILVTALETQADQARGLEAGADAYLPKSAFDQAALLAAIKQLL